LASDIYATATRPTKEVSVVRPHRNAPSVNERPDDLQRGEHIISRNDRRRGLAQLKGQC